jgi:16S rRNA (guanine527-N7)-methyltransferase
MRGRPAPTSPSSGASRHLLPPGEKGNAHDADRTLGLGLVPVSRETEERLAVYVELLRRWQAVKNLVGPGTLNEVWTRHIADSAQLVPLAPAAKTWADIGSGAGFPGLVVAILLREVPNARVHLVESNGRKCAFLREVARETGAPATVHSGRIEDVLDTLDGVEVLTARALAPLPQLLLWGKRLIDAGTLGLFLKGEESERESAMVTRQGYAIEAVPSRTHAAGRILRVRAATGSEAG